MTYAVLGPIGTFSEEAVRIYSQSNSHIWVTENISDLFELVEKGQVSDGLVPLENSATGIISITMECLAASTLKIKGTIEIPIKQYLLANGNYKPKEIQLLISQKVALEQCRRYINKNLKGVRTEITESTARAAQLVREETRRAAAIGSRRLARLYGLKIIEAAVQDGINYTRFIHIAANSSDAVKGNNSSLILSLPHKVGALYNLLEVFTRFKLNLQKIESFPAESPGNYIFYIEVEKEEEDINMELLLHELRPYSNWVKYLGSYTQRRIIEC
ncbi:MAG: hypothetical protein GX808_01855 [Syntrophomonadaceae bacterium]|jgi:prephenate dehydratase|nr:hypothetical protein [Syntrophomonadaceae bacterium]